MEWTGVCCCALTYGDLKAVPQMSCRDIRWPERQRMSDVCPAGCLLWYAHVQKHTMESLFLSINEFWTHTHSMWMNGCRGGHWVHEQEKIYTCTQVCVVCTLPWPNSRAGLTQPDSMLAYVRSYFCQRLAIQPLPSSPCFSLVMLSVSLCDI